MQYFLLFLFNVFNAKPFNECLKWQGLSNLAVKYFHTNINILTFILKSCGKSNNYLKVNVYLFLTSYYSRRLDPLPNFSLN